MKKIEEYLQITSPFLDRFNDYLQVYAKIDKNNEILLRDELLKYLLIKMAFVRLLFFVVILSSFIFFLLHYREMIVSKSFQKML